MNNHTDINTYLFLGPDEVDPENIVCDKCKTKDVLIVGKVFRVYLEEIKDGVLCRSVMEHQSEEIDQIICTHCKICYITVTQYVYDLQHKDDNFFKDIGLKKEN